MSSIRRSPPSRGPKLVRVEGAAVREALLEPGLSSQWLEVPTPFHAGRRPVADDGRISRWFLFLEGHRHRELRRIVTPPFASSAVRGQRSEIVRDARQLVASLSFNDVDVQRQLTYPLAAQTVCRLTGVSREFESAFQTWSDAIAEYLVHDFVPEVVDRGRRALDALADAAEAAIATRHESMSAASCLAHAIERKQITSQDAAATLTLLVYAGFVTTQSLLDNVIFEVVSSGQLEAARRRDGAAALVHQTLGRFPAVPRVARRALRDLHPQGIPISDGDLVLIQLGRAGVKADESAVFPFGHGRHYCLGATMARVEAESLIYELASRFDVQPDSVAAKLRPQAPDEPRLFDELVLRTLAPRSCGLSGNCDSRGS